MNINVLFVRLAIILDCKWVPSCYTNRRTRTLERFSAFMSLNIINFDKYGIIYVPYRVCHRKTKCIHLDNSYAKTLN